MKNKYKLKRTYLYKVTDRRFLFPCLRKYDNDGWVLDGVLFGWCFVYNFRGGYDDHR